MKKFILSMATLLMCSMSLLAQSNIVLFSEDGDKFFVVLNGVRQNETAETNVKITDLNQPGYKAKIIFEDPNLPQLDKTLMVNPGMELVYAIKKNKKGEYVVRGLSETPIAQAPAPAQGQNVVTYTTVAPVAAVSVTETVTTTTVNDGMGENVNMGFNMGGMGMNVNVNINDPYMTGSSQTTTSYTTTTATSSTTSAQPAPADHYVMPGYNGRVGCPWPMSDSDFRSAKSSIQSKSFEDSKLTMAKQVFGSNCMTSGQVKEVMQTFDFEETKLDFAKYAYGYTFDLNNYYKVNDAFDFESSIEELNSYIQGR